MIAVSIGLSLMLSAIVQAAAELTSEQADTMQPFDKITITGRFNAISEAVQAVSRRADKLGADTFCIRQNGNSNSGGNWRVVADLYHSNAIVARKVTEYRFFNGIKELSKNEADTLQPAGTVTVKGLFHTQLEVNNAIAKIAKKRDASSFIIVRQVNINQGNNQSVTAYIYTADAKPRIKNPDAITADRPVTADRLGNSKRYTVTLKDGTKIEELNIEESNSKELNKESAAHRIPFDSVTFRGHFNTMTQISEEVAKRAAARGASHYQITRQWQSQNGGNLTVSADLFK